MRDRILRSFGADALGQALNICIRILLVPLFLKAWGAEGYGEWLILTAIIGWFNLGDFGAQLYFINRMTAEWARGRLEIFQALLSTGLVFLISISIILFTGTWLCLHTFPIVRQLGIHYIASDAIGFIILVVAFKFLFSLPFGLLLGVYRAIGSQATSVMFGNLVLLLQFIASAFCLLFSGDMRILALAEVIPFLLVCPIVIWDLNRRLPNNINLSLFRRMSKNIFLDSMSPSIQFLGIQLSAALLTQGVVVVIGKTLGPIEVSIFSACRIIANVVSRMMSMISHAAWPEITKLQGLGEHTQLGKLFNIVLKLTLLIGVFYLVGTIEFGEVLFGLWLNNGLPYDFWLMYVLVCHVLATAFWTWGGNILMATNQHREFSLLQIPVNFVSLFFCFWGARHYGLIGSAVALFVAQTIPMMVVIYLLLRKYMPVQLARSFLIASILALVMMPLALLLNI